MTRYLIGIAGGLASALLYAAVLSGGGLAMPLFMLSPLPVAIVGLGWGTGAGVVAAFASAGVLGGFFMPLVGIGYLVLVAGPMAFYAYLVGLARPRDDGVLEWYPLARVLLAIASVTAVTFVGVGIASGFTPEGAAALLTEMLTEVFAAAPEAGDISDTDIAEVAALYVRLMPFAVTFTWVVMMGLCLWLGARIVTISGRFRRPPLRLADEIGMPVPAVGIFAVAAFFAFTANSLGLAAGAVAGAFGMAFAIVGFAVVHVRTRGVGGRGLILGILYGLTFIISLPLLPLAMLGGADSLFNLRARRQPGA